jgi:Fe-S cluster assembly iron-binding protein IscA
MTATELAPTQVVLTDRAAKRVSRILAKEPEGTVLRISVAGGGCSGFQYDTISYRKNLPATISFCRRATRPS